MDSAPIKVCISGASGKMGQMLITAAMADPDVKLVSAIDRTGSHFVGRDAGDFFGEVSGAVITDDARAAIALCDVLIDFTRPEATLGYASLCLAMNKRLVVGTTGFTAEQRAELSNHAQSMGIVFSPNMSVAMNVMFKLTQIATELLAQGYDIEVIEAHHNRKIDAPSGTALGLGNAIANALQKPLDEIALYERHGDIGPRKAGTVGFSTVRGGDIIGDHTVMFADTGERIEISHRSQSRDTYAQGAMRATKFIVTKTTGMFDMRAVLGL